MQIQPAQFVTSLAAGERIVSTYEFWGAIIVATNTRILLLGGKAPREVPMACLCLDVGRA